MATADVLESLSFAYGARGVAKLIDRLRLEGDEPQPEEDIVANCDSLTRLNGLLSNQESKLVALGHDSLVPTLKGMLGHSAADPRRLAALSLASLALVFQGRLAIRDEEVVAVLSELVGNGKRSGEGVAEASCSVLLNLSESRDGCVALMQHGGLVPTLVASLDDASVAEACLSTLANLLRQDLGVLQALDAGVVPQLDRILSTLEGEPLKKGLQALWNLANTPEGKQAAVDASLLPKLAGLVSSGSAEEKRLAAGCVLAVTINKQGKINSFDTLEPLLSLVLDPSSDHDTVRDALGALKNAAEYPKARKEVERIGRKRGIDPSRLVSFVKGPMFDAEPWPASLRYLNQFPKGLGEQEYQFEDTP